MSRRDFEFSFVSRNGRQLVVVVVARISTEHQDKRSLDDQVALAKQYVEERHDGPIEWVLITSRASGEYLDREELVRLEQLIESGTVDVVICEDLARICRRTRAYELCEVSVDNGVRLIALNDHVDTASPDWQLNAFFSVFRHESYNRDTAARIRRTQRNRFLSGGMIKQPLFCYIKPAGCKSDSELQKNADLEAAVVGIFDRLEKGWSFSRVADWLNANNVPLGVHCKRAKWDGAMVRRVVFNPILKGVRVWNAKRSVRINKTGRRRQTNAPPEDRIERSVQHLAFIDADRYDLLVAKLVKQGESYSVPKRRGDDPRKGRPKKRTRWPGQHVYCGICGKMFVYGGHGKKQHLMCSGAREYGCWNGVTFDAELAATRISEAVFEFLKSLPNFEPALLTTLRNEAVKRQHDRHQQLHRAMRELEQSRREEQRLIDAIKRGGELDVLLSALKDAEGKRRSLENECHRLEKQQPPPIEVPSIEIIRQDVQVAVADLSLSSPEFGDCMREIINKIAVYPVRLCDGGNPVLRAIFEVNFTPYLPESMRLPALESQLRAERVVDLFDMPQRAAYRERVVALRAEGLTERQVADRVGLTVTATQRAAALDRIMRQLEITDPYLPVTAPIEGNKRYRRHRHQRYRRRSDDGDAAA